MFNSPLQYFTDPLLRGPTIGCMLMCLVAALVGVITFLRKQSLLGESLSHAAYPGVILGVLSAGVLAINESNSSLIILFIIIGAFSTSLLGLFLIQFMERSLKIPADASLCFVLSIFFGIGITLASDIQFTYTSLYRQVQAYLYGQAATMTDTHIIIYSLLSFVVILSIFLFYKEIQISIFNKDFANTIGLSVKTIDVFFFILIVLAIVIGIRSVGVVMMSAMLVSPVVAARQYTHKLSTLFILSGVVGMLSGFLGNYLSVEMDRYFIDKFNGLRLVLPTGPMIVLLASIFCLISLLFSRQGIVLRVLNRKILQYHLISQNIIKAIYKNGKKITFNELHTELNISKFYLSVLLSRLQKNGQIKKVKNEYIISSEEEKTAERIIEIHQRWGEYLASHHGEYVPTKLLTIDEIDKIMANS